MSKPFCVICLKKSTETLSPFTETSFNKCKIVLAVREKNNLLFKDVILPSKITNNHMYHRACYKRFTALPKKHRLSGESSSISTSSRETSEANVEASTSNNPR